MPTVTGVLKNEYTSYLMQEAKLYTHTVWSWKETEINFF